MMPIKERFNPDDLSRLERELNIRLPLPYKEALLHYPFAPDSSPYAWEVMADIDWLIEKNTYCRSHGFFGKHWPDDYLVIGGDGTGSLYFLDVSKSDSAIFFADHNFTARSDKLEVEEEAPNLAAWLEYLREQQSDPE